MHFRIPDVRIADVETCDFNAIEAFDTDTLLQAARPEDWRRISSSPTARRMLDTLGVTTRHLTHLPGQRPDPARRTAFDLARSAVERLWERRRDALEHLDALIFVSTSNPHPCNSQAALLASEFGWRPSCYDLKAGCSTGILGLMQGALLLQGGAHRVLVVMAENLSHLTPREDLRMLLTVGDGAACILLERHAGPGFLSVLHGSDPAHASAMHIRAPFPPVGPEVEYVYQFTDTVPVATFLHQRWRELFHEVLASSALTTRDLAHCFFHQTHRAQVDGLATDLDLATAQIPLVVTDRGNIGTPSFAVALARGFHALRDGDRYLMQAVGGGVSWGSIIAEHS